MLERNTPTRSATDTDSDLILDFLTNRQHLHPHDSLNQVLELAIDHFGCCPQAIARGLEWLKLDGDSAIGRLRRSELLQLSRVIHRFWSQASSEAPVVSR